MAEALVSTGAAYAVDARAVRAAAVVENFMVVCLGWLCRETVNDR